MNTAQLPEILQLPLGPLQTNCYLLICRETNQAAVIDPSWDGEAIAGILDEKEAELTHILLTHAHFDHVGGLDALKKVKPAPIYIHSDAVEMLKQAPHSAAFFNLQFPSPPLPDKFVEEGDQLQVGNLILETLFTPGHAPGHVSFYLREYGVLFDGDVLFQGSIGRTDLPGGDHELLLQVIREKLLVLPDETHVLSGHGPATTIGAERGHNPFLQGG